METPEMEKDPARKTRFKRLLMQKTVYPRLESAGDTLIQTDPDKSFGLIPAPMAEDPGNRPLARTFPPETASKTAQWVIEPQAVDAWGNKTSPACSTWRDAAAEKEIAWRV
jgi:hypothetical protein